MAAIIAEFFQVVGLNADPPNSMQELIPYFLTIFIGVSLVSAVFGVLGHLAEFVLNFMRWK